MEIIFRNNKLEKVFNSEKQLQREYGEQSRYIARRMAVLRAASCLAEVPTKKPECRHGLKGEMEGLFAVDLKHPFRLVFKPVLITGLNQEEDKGLDLTKVVTIMIWEVEDYH